MTRLIRSLALVAALALGGCASAAGASSAPQLLTFQEAPADVSGRIASACAERGMLVVSATPNQVRCEVQMDAGAQVVAQMLVGNSYSTTPRNIVQFTLFQSGAQTGVQVIQWIESTTAFGQTNQEIVTNADSRARLRQFLLGIGASEGVAPAG